MSFSAAETVSGSSGGRPGFRPRSLASAMPSRVPDPSLLRHVSPLGWDHIVLIGDYDWNSGPAQRTNVWPLNLYPTKIRV